MRSISFYCSGCGRRVGNAKISESKLPATLRLNQFEPRHFLNVFLRRNFLRLNPFLRLLILLKVFQEYKTFQLQNLYNRHNFTPCSGRCRQIEIVVYIMCILLTFECNQGWDGKEEEGEFRSYQRLGQVKKEKWADVFNKTQLRTGKFEQNNEVPNDAYSRLIKVSHKGSLHNY